jgi:hypothetical protein
MSFFLFELKGYLGSAEKVGSATYLKPTRCRCILILQIAGGFKEVVLPAN